MIQFGNYNLFMNPLERQFGSNPQTVQGVQPTYLNNKQGNMPPPPPIYTNQADKGNHHGHAGHNVPHYYHQNNQQRQNF